MDIKEIREIKNVLKPGNSNVTNIFGSYISNAGSILAEMEIKTSELSGDEEKLYFKFLRRVLTGDIGKKLTDVTFTDDTDEYRLLQGLKESRLEDEALRKLFFERICENVQCKSNYVVLLAFDTYDVPFKGKDGEEIEDASEDVFEYIVCSICPIKDTKAILQYDPDAKRFKGVKAGGNIDVPDMGFMFPLFEEREANESKVLYYSKNLSNDHENLIGTVFGKTDLKEKLEAAKEKQEKEDKVKAVKPESDNNVSLMEDNETESNQKNKDIFEGDGTDIDVSELPEEEVQQDPLIDISKEPPEFPGIMLPEENNEHVESVIRILMNPEFVATLQTKTIEGKEYILIPAIDNVSINGIMFDNNSDTENQK